MNQADTVVSAGADTGGDRRGHTQPALLTGDTSAAQRGVKVGYARVSTREQHLEQQLAALRDAGCTRIFQEKASGTNSDRPQLQATFDYLRPEDTLVVWRLDRLGRSLRHLVATVATLGEAGIGFQSIHESIETTTSTGRLVFHIFAALAEFERDLIADRTQEGLAAAREKGKIGGRPRALTPERIELARSLRREGRSYSAIAALLNVSDRTVRRVLSGG